MGAARSLSRLWKNYHERMPLTRRQIFRRRRLAVFGLSTLVVAICLYLPFTLLAPLAPAEARVLPYAGQTQPAAQLGWPGYGASAIGAIGYQGTLATSGSIDPLPIASISKIVTALVVLETKPLTAGQDGPTVTFTAANAALYGKYVALKGKVEPMKAGSSLSQLDFMRVTLISSANNYAAALADWAYGSEPAFIRAAQAWLRAHGLNRTTLIEPTGMSSGNTSTASDLVAIGKLALANPVIASIVSTRTLSLPQVGELQNTNDLLGLDGVEGIKTGTLDEAGACLLFASKHQIGSQTVTIVGAVLGGVDHKSLDAAVRSLLKDVRAGFHEVTLARIGQVFVSFSTPWRDDADAVATKNVSALVWSNTPIIAIVDANDVRLARKATRVGAVTFTVGTQTVTVPLALDHNVEDPGPWWRLGNPFALLPSSG